MKIAYTTSVIVAKMAKKLDFDIQLTMLTAFLIVKTLAIFVLTFETPKRKNEIPE